MTAYQPDYYAALGVSRHASQDEIKLGYRRAAFKTHPDRDGGSETRFKLVGEAYDTLSDRAKRTAYDQNNPLAGLKTAQQNAAPPSAQPTPEPQNDNLVDRVNAIVDHWNDYLDTLENLGSLRKTANLHFQKTHADLFMQGAVWDNDLIRPQFNAHADAARTTLRTQANETLDVAVNKFSSEDRGLGPYILDVKRVVKTHTETGNMINTAGVRAAFAAIEEKLAKRQDVIQNTLDVIGGKTTDLRYKPQTL
ncbi:J domain-containing protein [Micavibrio aeruginosavorus]|uniref:DnaJ domain protein n=1 Tax=Micavibrio aeruginosavorus (strain ARL-13) TaxID=856793 RepID=G2KM54_MICAA|nr:DnaJ domain-containing protein [Micavibrio aeruginosavorus]AEP09750.1 dnaJ domain protein [Micavibrio aeruginosavorus ARL-13]